MRSMAGAALCLMVTWELHFTSSASAMACSGQEKKSLNRSLQNENCFCRKRFQVFRRLVVVLIVDLNAGISGTIVPLIETLN